jgi:signal transduction histidine kinase
LWRVLFVPPAARSASAFAPLGFSPLRPAGRRVQWSLVVLLLSIGLAAVSAFNAQRVVRRQRSVAERALREYASFAAWSYAEHLAVTLDAIGREVLGAVNHGDNMHTSPMVPTAGQLARMMPWDARCSCQRLVNGPTPDAFFALDLRARTVNTDVGGSVDNQWLLDSLPTRFRSQAGLNRGVRFVVDAKPGADRILAYTLMATAWGDTIVYGARYEAASFARILARALDSPGLLPYAFTNGRPNRDVITIAVTDKSGRSLFTTTSDASNELASRVTSPFAIDSIRVEAAVRPEVASTLLIGGLPAAGAPYSLALLGLAAALSVIAVVQIRREGELARLRAGFVSSVSHELRTPVAQIRLYVETLRLGRAASAERREWALAHIERETRRLTYLVENVLRFSTLDRTITAPELVDPARAVREIVGEFEPLAASRGVSIDVEASPTPGAMVRADALRHMVVNLLDNAVKYGPREQTVRVRVGSAAGNVTISVEDEGPGIPSSERESIWRPFTRGRAATATGGSGIGLTIVRELARAHGGSARVDPEFAPGSRFLITLPTADQSSGLEG